jgi:thioredoxin 1
MEFKIKCKKCERTVFTRTTREPVTIMCDETTGNLTDMLEPTAEATYIYKCQKCKHVLSERGIPNKKRYPCSSILTVTDKNFAETVKTGVAAIDFYASWCTHCKPFTRVIEQLCEDTLLDKLAHDNLHVDVVFAKIDYDKSPKTIKQHNVKSLPTLLIFKNGKEHSRIVGYDKDTRKEIMKAIVNATTEEA